MKNMINFNIVKNIRCQFVRKFKPASIQRPVLEADTVSISALKRASEQNPSKDAVNLILHTDDNLRLQKQHPVIGRIYSFIA